MGSKHCNADKRSVWTTKQIWLKNILHLVVFHDRNFLSIRTFQLAIVDKPDMHDTAGDVSRGSIVMYSYGPLRMAEQKQGDQLETTYNSSVRIRGVALRTCRNQWTIGRGVGRGPGISVLMARQDYDIYIYIYIYIYILKIYLLNIWKLKRIRWKRK